MPKCFYCSNEGLEQKRVCVDVDICHDLDDDGKEIFTQLPLYSTEWLCQDHLNELEDEGYIGKH
jgi:hypothetical protein